MFDHAFYSPEGIIQHAKHIGLTDEQEVYIKAEYKKAQAEFTDANWDLKKATSALHDLISKDKVDETKALAQLDKILALEKRIKRQKISLMIRVKNKLTDAQKKKLDQLKKHHEHMKGQHAKGSVHGNHQGQAAGEHTGKKAHGIGKHHEE
jgi:Spy/CpxP family protein refolding chaperone